MDIAELAAMMLPWAKEKMPDAYQATLQVANKPRSFAGYLARLVELRWEQEKEWRLQAPLRALEMTSIVARFKLPNGDTIEVAGSKYKGERTWGFSEMALLYEQKADLMAVAKMKSDWGLAHDSPYFQSATTPTLTTATSAADTSMMQHSSASTKKKKSAPLQMSDDLFGSR